MLGVLIAFYDIFRLKRRIVRTRTVMVHIEDTFLADSINSNILASYNQQRRNRAYFYAGAFLGALLYIGLLAACIMAVNSVDKIIAWPICKMIEFMKPVIGRSISERKNSGKN